LAVNAPVEFKGIPLGNVVSIRMDYDEKSQTFPIYVGAVIYPDRLGRAHEKLVQVAKAQGDNDDLSHMIGTLVGRGLRAQARSGNLLTGQLYISLDFIPKAPKVAYDPNARPLEIPTAPGDFDKLQEQIGQIVDKIQKIPFDSIGKNLNDSLAELDRTLKQVNGQVLPEVRNTLKGANQTFGTANTALAADSPLQQNLTSTLQQLQRMAQSLRVLTDYLGAHPDALIRGRRADPSPTTDNSAPAASPSNAKPQQGSNP
jgi:paraquat-inducible protein B